MLLCAGMLVGLLGWTTVLSVEQAVAPTAMERVLKQMDMGAMAKQFSFVEGDNIINRVIVRVADSDAMLDVLKQYASGAAMYMLKGGKEFEITNEQRQALVEAGVAAVKEESGGLSSVMEQLTRLQMAVTIQGLLMKLPDYKTLTKEMDPSLMMLLHNFFSENMRILYVGIVVAALILIFFLRWSWYEWLGWGGITALVGGFCMLIGSWEIPRQMGSILTSSSSMSDKMEMAIANEVAVQLRNGSLWVCGIALAMTVAFFIIRSQVKKGQKMRHGELDVAW